MTHHAFIDESTRGRKYLICAATITTTDLTSARRELKALRAAGQRRIHFSTESDQRRRAILKEMSTLKTNSVIYVAEHRNHVAARAAIVATAVAHLHQVGVSRLVLEAREGQDSHDRAVIYSVLGPDPSPPMAYTHHRPASEPLLWIPDAVAWAWGRGGHWRTQIEGLAMVSAVEIVEVA